MKHYKYFTSMQQPRQKLIAYNRILETEISKSTTVKKQKNKFIYDHHNMTITDVKVPL